MNKTTVVNLLPESKDFDLFFEKEKELKREVFRFVYRFEDLYKLERIEYKSFGAKCYAFINKKLDAHSIKTVKERELNQGNIEDAEGNIITLKRGVIEALEITVEYHIEKTK